MKPERHSEVWKEAADALEASSKDFAGSKQNMLLMLSLMCMEVAVAYNNEAQKDDRS